MKMKIRIAIAVICAVPNENSPFHPRQDSAMLVVIMIVIIYGFYLFPLILVPSLALYFVFQRFFRRASREVKRVESIAKSPIFNHFSDSLKVGGNVTDDTSLSFSLSLSLSLSLSS